MARLPEEQWAMIEDSIEKKRTAASAFKQRTHCGKGGSVKFPSDYMTKKELNAMNGDVISYRMNSPLSWDEFKELPNDLKANYIKSLRAKFSVPDNQLAEMFDISLAKLTLYLSDLKLEYVHNTEIWNKEAFLAWRSGGSSEAVKENDISEAKTEVTRKYDRNPMKWEEFKKLPNPEKVAYIRWLEDTFGVPNKNIADMFGIGSTYLSHVRTNLGCNAGSSSAASKKGWDSTEFDAWARGEAIVEEAEPAVEPVVEKTVEAAAKEILEMIVNEPTVENVVEPAAVQRIDIPELTVKGFEPVRAIPTTGSMTFQSSAEQILNMLSMVLGDTNVKLSVQWEIVE